MHANECAYWLPDCGRVYVYVRADLWIFASGSAMIYRRLHSGVIHLAAGTTPWWGGGGGEEAGGVT